jgi:hypothetical protein
VVVVTDDKPSRVRLCPEREIDEATIEENKAPLLLYREAVKTA